MFCKKKSKFVHFDPYGLAQLSPACDVQRSFRLPVSAFATVYRTEEFVIANLLQKLIFRSGILLITITDTDIGSLKYRHTLFD